MVQQEPPKLEDSVLIVQSKFNMYPYLSEQKQPYFELDTERKVVDISDLNGGIDWIFEQCNGIFDVFEYAYPNNETVAAVLNTEDTIDYLVRNIKRQRAEPNSTI